MDGHLQELLYAIGSIAATVSVIYGMMRNMLKDMEDRMNKRFDAMDKRFDAVDKRFDAFQEQMDKRFAETNKILQQINQNHIDHLMALHAVPASNREQSERNA